MFLLPERPADFAICCSFDLPNQRVIRNDSERTRNDLLLTREKYVLELLLTYYCKNTHTFYKQGLNELLAPFLILGRHGLTLTEIYLYFHNFIRNYMPTLFIDKDFRTLQVLMQLYKSLLKYFDPELSGFLEDLGIGPELYASPWFLTLFASKIEDISIVFNLWEAYMTENDHLHNLFLSLALVIVNRKRILRTQKSGVAQALTELTIPTGRHLSKILEKAQSLKRSLPYSSYIHLSSYPLHSVDQLDSLLAKLEASDSLTILPREIIMRCYPSVFNCMCFGGTCQWCTRSSKPVPLVILDCRLPEEQEAGVIPNTLLFDYESSEFIDKVLALRGEFHIALMGGQVQGLLWELRKLNVPYVGEVEGGFKDCCLLYTSDAADE